MSCDIASVVIARKAEQVFDFMSDASKLDLWSFGTWKTEIDNDGIVHGKALHDGRDVCVRIVPHRETRLIDYHVGSDAGNLTPRIFARIIPGLHFSDKNDQSLLLMTAVRADTMDAERWRSLKSIHAVEVDLIKSLIETGYDHRT
jgi:uncharacterized protein YndB with AHSA1/START domain